MSDDTLEKAEQIFLEAIELPPGQRASFVDQKCADDAKLKRLVNSFLEADDAAEGVNFLESHFLAGATLVPDLPPPKRSEEDDPIADRDPPFQDARFRILSRYEQGGLGEVMIAHDRQLDREVAVKQIRPKWLGNNEARERFIQEAEVTGRLEHPGIVPVYAMGTWEDGRPFYAMRFIQGSTLKQVIAESRASIAESDPQTKRMELRALLNRFVDVCNTIEYAHSRQILHRDIKPSNIMVGPYGETLVVDWGLAKLLDEPFHESMTAAFVAQYSKDQKPKEDGSSRTQIGGTVGTPQYMSPEQAAGELQSIGICTDVYLLGSTLYQILTGVPPHNEESVSKLIDRVKRGILTRPSEVDTDVPSALEAICLKAMSTKASDRYPSAARLSADIERWLADQPVSVFNDPASVRLGRWIRRHRTLAMSGMVAALLLTAGSVLGSMLWNYQRSQQFKVEQERNLKDAQLIASREQRINELRESASSALDLSLREIRAEQFAAALSLLRKTSEAIADEPSLKVQRDEIDARSQRLRKLVEFYQQAELSEQYNVTSRDTQGIMASTASLKALDVWDTTDWWAQLPDEDLTPQQRDKLRWDVYQQWLMLDGMLIKTIGTRLFGTGNTGSTLRVLSALRRLGSSAGKREAKAALVVSDRVDLFRQSEAARWYRSIGHYRLGSGRRLKGEEIGVPRNAPDAQKLGVLCLLSAMDPSFRVVFRDYESKDATIAGRDLFQRSASLRPDHYWTQISLAQMQYFIAEQESQPTWESYQPAVQTMGRCIAINPKSCFAFADRSSLFRFQWEQMKTDTREDETIRGQRASELLRWSLQDAQTAYRLGGDQPWVGWTYGIALSAAGQDDEAIDILLEASRRTFPLMAIGDATLIRADDIRGRSAAVQYASEGIERKPEDLRYQILLASIRLNQEAYEESLEQIEIAMDQLETSGEAFAETRAEDVAHAHAIRGMIFLQNEQFQQAADDFRLALASDATHLWASYGAAACDDASGQHESALAKYEQSLRLATTDEHRAASLLGIGRAKGFLGEYAEASQVVTEAQRLQPACDVESVARPLVEWFKVLRSKSADQEQLVALRDFLQSLSQLHVATRIEFAPTPEVTSFQAPLLNGDFELDAFRYWSDELGAFWRNEPGHKSSAEISAAEVHSGNHSLRLIGDTNAGRDRQSSTERFGYTAQEFPVPANSACRLSLWAKSQQIDEGAVRLMIDDRVTLELPKGTYDWRALESEFVVGEALDPTQTTVPLTLKIISAGAGEVFLDDIQLTVTR